MKITIADHIASDAGKLAWRLLPRSLRASTAEGARLLRKGLLLLPSGKHMAARTVNDWAAIENLGRSDQRVAHMHAFIGDAVDTYERGGDVPILEQAYSLALTWTHAHSWETHARKMAYHDEATARRVAYWTRLLVALSIADPEFATAELKARLEIEVDILSNESFHAGKNNHGMFQDLALLYHAALFDDHQAKAKSALRRLVKYFEWSVAADGVHKEHSPAYNYLIARNMSAHLGLFRKFDAAGTRRVRAVLHRMARYAVNIVTPEGRYPPLGDTSPCRIPQGYAKTFTNGLPSPELEACAIFQDGGYAILRDNPALEAAQTYAVFSASHHGNYHKHADDLALIVYSGGWIITDSGPYGYDYAHPLSRHAYSSAAHSTLHLPYLTPAATPGKVKFTQWSNRDGISTVTGENRRHQDIVHTRKVEFDRASRRISVHDDVTGSPGHRKYILWQLAHDIRAVRDGNEFHLIRGGRKIAKISISTEISRDFVSVGQGQAEGEISGYAFPDFGQAADAPVIAIEGPRAAHEWHVETAIILPPADSRGRILPYELGEGEWPVQYLLDRKPASKRLVVIFPALASKYKYPINYKKSLHGMDASCLYLVDDFGPQGSYLICSHGSFTLADSVAALIEARRIELGVPQDQVVFLGSNKGGATALYMADRLGYGTVIAGAPQTRIGHFLCEQDRINGPTIAAHMFPDGDRQASLDALLYASAAHPAVKRYIHVGRGDHHYASHVLPYASHLRNAGAHIELDIAEYQTHAETGTHFPPYFFCILGKLYGAGAIQKSGRSSVRINVLDSEPSRSGSRFLRAHAECAEPDAEIAYYLVRNGETIEKRFYGAERTADFELPSMGGKFHVRAYFRHDGTIFDKINSGFLEITEDTSAA